NPAGTHQLARTIGQSGISAAQEGQCRSGNSGGAKRAQRLATGNAGHTQIGQNTARLKIAVLHRTPHWIFYALDDEAYRASTIVAYAKKLKGDEKIEAPLATALPVIVGNPIRLASG